MWDTGHAKRNCRASKELTTTFVFKPIIQQIIEAYSPKVIMLQRGAVSLAYDSIGDFSLMLKGHGWCVTDMKSFNVTTLVLGGGGYNIVSMARYWAYETALLLDTRLENAILYNDYWAYFVADRKLHIASHNRAAPTLLCDVRGARRLFIACAAPRCARKLYTSGGSTIITTTSPLTTKTPCSSPSGAGCRSSTSTPTSKTRVSRTARGSARRERAARRRHRLSGASHRCARVACGHPHGAMQRIFLPRCRCAKRNLSTTVSKHRCLPHSERAKENQLSVAKMFSTAPIILFSSLKLRKVTNDANSNHMISNV